MTPALAPPRILHVFATFAPGGPQVRTARLMNALGGDFRHAVLAMDGRSDARELVERQVGLEVLPALPKAGSLRTVPALKRLLAATPHDLLATYNFGSIDAVAAARWRGEEAHVHHEDGFLPDEVVRFKQRRVWARRLLLRRVRGLIVPSHNLRDIALGVWHVPEERVHWIPNGVRVADYARADGNPELRAALGIPRDATLVGSVGHLRGEKNLARLLAAAAPLAPSVHVLLVGDGPERADLERRAAAPDLAGRVHFTGHRPDLPVLYRAMDVFAMSSDTEQMPVALLEAMAAALPVAATDVGDIARTLPEEGRSLVVPLGSGAVGALSDALARLAADRTLRARLGAANEERVRERFTFEGMVAAYRERYLHGLGG